MMLKDAKLKPQSYDAVIFTDGSSRGNPGPGGWGMVVVLPSAEWVDEFGAASEQTTNNEMELIAILEALQYIRIKNPKMKVLLLSDSSYALNGVTSWVAGWKRRGWKTATGGDVANLEVWQQIEELNKGLHITYQHIRGHVGIVGNERVDAIATAYADGADPRLYSGAFARYNIQNILDLSPTIELIGKKKTNSRTVINKDTWYVSLVDGKVVRHNDWASCRGRVHGVNAKFKKVSSKIEETQIFQKWGV